MGCSDDLQMDVQMVCLMQILTTEGYTISGEYVLCPNTCPEISNANLKWTLLVVGSPETRTLECKF